MYLFEYCRTGIIGRIRTSWYIIFWGASCISATGFLLHESSSRGAGREQRNRQGSFHTGAHERRRRVNALLLHCTSFVNAKSPQTRRVAFAHFCTHYTGSQGMELKRLWQEQTRYTAKRASCEAFSSWTSSAGSKIAEDLKAHVFTAPAPLWATQPNTRRVKCTRARRMEQRKRKSLAGNNTVEENLLATIQTNKKRNRSYEGCDSPWSWLCECLHVNCVSKLDFRNHSIFFAVWDMFASSNLLLADCSRTSEFVIRVLWVLELIHFDKNWPVLQIG